jgi:hypothetical protein
VNLEEMTFDEQIAEAVPKKRYCQWTDSECRTPLAHANKGDLCFRHQRLENEQRCMRQFAHHKR